jgi:NTP pyrophosphatase (non-canonical NTP hydrolase)
LAGEAGEVADKIKKMLRDKIDSPEYREQVMLELGDVLWYAAVLASDLGYDLETVANRNLEKLQGRQKRGTLHGTGDNR